MLQVRNFDLFILDRMLNTSRLDFLRYRTYFEGRIILLLKSCHLSLFNIIDASKTQLNIWIQDDSFLGMKCKLRCEMGSKVSKVWQNVSKCLTLGNLIVFLWDWWINLSSHCFILCWGVFFGMTQNINITVSHSLSNHRKYTKHSNLVLSQWEAIG